MPENKIFSINRLVKIIRALKKRRKRIVFTNGCFDILHVGHISYLNRAKKFGDILVVGINSDSSVKAIKGINRPVNPLKDRIKVLASLESIDYVCSFREPTPLNVIKKISPQVLVKGGDWKNKEIVGANFVKNYSGKIIIIPFKKGYSTTSLFKKIVSLHK